MAELFFGIILFLLVIGVVGVVAGKRGLRWWAYELACVILTPLVLFLTGAAAGSGINVWFATFIVPGVLLAVILASNTSERDAVLNGASGEYRKCPFCAEAVRNEAIKCKHCGSSLEPTVTV